jgi:hypothetical protein
MKPKFRLFCLLTISLCFYNCSGTYTKNKELATMGQPEFVDNGKTVDSLKKVYNCESIDYENWGDKKETDSCLTVCLINSSIVPLVDNADKQHLQLKEIASTIKKSLTKPQIYKSFYIIFIEKVKVGGEEFKVHSLGGEIRSKDL